jgi:hemolysin activation/secretion protein
MMSRWGGSSGILLGLLFAGVILAGGSALAQAPTRGEVDLQERIPERPELTPGPEEPVITEGEAEAEEPVEEAFSFRLNGVNITRATIYDADDFEPLYQEFVGAEVTLGNLREIADRIESLYREDGYVATRAIIPPQAIANGVPTIEVYEGQIVYYEINGDVGPVKKQIAKLLDNLITGEPARWSELERYLLLARDLPGISLTGTLRSAGDTAPGGVVVVVDTARKAIDGFVNFQNLSSDLTGPDTLSGGGALNSNTAVGERVGFVLLSTVVDPLEQLSGFMSYQQSLGGDGLLLKAAGTLTRSQPGAELKDADIETDSLVLNVHLEYPLMRGRVFSLWTRGGFEYLDQNSVTGTDAELFDDQVRVFFGGLHGVWRPWGGGLTQFDVELRKGLETFGAATESGVGRSRLDAEPDYLMLRGELEHLQPLGPYWGINLRGMGQYSNEPLTSIDEMALGDLTIGRGYEAGSVTGDSGYGIAAELRFSTPDFVSETLQKYIDRVEIYGFLDYARVYDKGTLFAESFQDVISTGFGVRVQALRTFYADFYYALPLEKGLEFEDKTPGNALYFNITKFF